MNALEVLIIIALILGIWYPTGSWLGRRFMRRIAGSCIELGGRPRIITPNSILVEHRIEGYRYVGIYIEWLPFDNPLNLAAKLIARRRAIAVIKIQPENPIPGEASITREDLAGGSGDKIDGYRATYRGISRPRMEYIVKRIKDKGFEKLVIGSKPNITIITTISGRECSEILGKSIDLVRELQAYKPIE